MEKGSLVADRNLIQVSEEIAELSVHGVLLSQGTGMPLSHLARHPALFPFKLQMNAANLRKREGLRSDFVELA